MAAAAVSSRVAMPRRRCDDETKRRGIPSGVDNGVGMRLSEEESSVLDEACEPAESSSPLHVSLGSALDDDRGAIAMAVDIRWATTQPTIFSRCADDEEDSEDSKNK